MKDGVITNENRINEPAHHPEVGQRWRKGHPVQPSGCFKNGPEAKFSLAPVAVALSASWARPLCLLTTTTLWARTQRLLLLHEQRRCRSAAEHPFPRKRPRTCPNSARIWPAWPMPMWTTPSAPATAPTAPPPV
ncbi:MAG: hypothetical protein ACLTNY_01435 [Blautia massiliensis (ex Durand et al. 2017)]